MPIVNVPEALPQAVFAVYRLLKQHALNKQELYQWMAPHDLVEDPALKYQNLFATGTTVVDAARNTLRNLDLLQMETDPVRGEVYRASDTEDATGQVSFRRLLRSKIFQLREDVSATDSEAISRVGSLKIQGTPEPEFVGAMRWFLQRDPYVAPTENNFDDYQVHDELCIFVSNSTQWDNFVRWGLYLGLLQKFQQKPLPDPTQAVLDWWPTARARYIGEVSVGHLASDLQQAFPYLVVTDQGKFSKAFSAALVALEERKLLKFFNLSDTQKLQLVLPHDQITVSHVSSSMQKGKA